MAAKDIKPKKNIAKASPRKAKPKAKALAKSKVAPKSKAMKTPKASQTPVVPAGKSDKSKPNTASDVPEESVEETPPVFLDSDEDKD